MAAIPVYNPVLPFLGVLPGGLRPGSTVRITGLMNHSSQRFVINLQNGPLINPRDDIALHLSIRPEEGCIVRNTMMHCQWSYEEKSGGLPIQSGQYFDISIRPDPSSFNISVNNTHLCDFKFRMGLEKAKYIQIDGAVTINSITMGDHYQPPVHPIHPGRPVFPSHPTAPIQPGWRPPVVVCPPPRPYVPIAPPVHHHTPGHPPHIPVIPPHHQGPHFPHHPTHPHHPPKKDKKKDKKDKHSGLKTAAVVGGVGLGAMAVAGAVIHSKHKKDKKLKKRKDSSSSSSSSS